MSTDKLKAAALQIARRWRLSLTAEDIGSVCDILEFLHAQEARRNDVSLWAWIGEDELGSGEVGLKQALVPAGCIPMVACRREKMDVPAILSQLQAQADRFGKPIQLARFVFAETLIEITPKGKR